MLRDRLVEREQFRIVERHGTRRDDGLTHALETEERVLRQQLLRLDVLPAKSLEVTTLTVVMDEADNSGDFLIRHGLLHGDVEFGEHVCLKSSLRGFVAMWAWREIGDGEWRCRCRGRLWQTRSSFADNFDLRRLLE